MDGREALEKVLHWAALWNVQKPHADYNEVTIAAKAYVAQLERERDEARATASEMTREAGRCAVGWAQANGKLAALRAAPCRVEHEPTEAMVDVGISRMVELGTSHFDIRLEAGYRAMERARVADASQENQ